MSGRLISRIAAGAVVGAVSLASTGIASASDAGLRTVVKQGVPRIERSQAKILNGVAKYQSSHSSGALVRALNAQDKTLQGLKSKVAASSPSTSAGRRAKTDIVKGLGLIVASNSTLASQIKKKASGQPVSKSAVKLAVEADLKGNLDLKAGLKLLKL